MSQALQNMLTCNIAMTVDSRCVCPDCRQSIIQIAQCSAGAGSAPSHSGSTYTVQSGDSLFLIATRFDLTLQQLLNANPSITDANVISPGQVLNIPRGKLNVTVLQTQLFASDRALDLIRDCMQNCIKLCRACRRKCTHRATIHH